MSNVQLLDKTRKIGRFLHNNNADIVVFDDMCTVMTEILSSNVLVISKKGKILGASKREDMEELKEHLFGKVGAFIDPEVNDRFLSVLSTQENLNLQTLGFGKQAAEKFRAVATPVEISGERLGTLFLYKTDGDYGIDDIILTEYCVNVVGLEMLRSVNEENAEEERKHQIVQAAFGTLSVSERDAMIHIFDALDHMEGILVASKIADRVGITRSVIVNAIRKFESAGIIESRSSGMKGTYIRVLNDAVYEDLDNYRASGD